MRKISSIYLISCAIIHNFPISLNRFCATLRAMIIFISSKLELLIRNGNASLYTYIKEYKAHTSAICLYACPFAHQITSYLFAHLHLCSEYFALSVFSYAKRNKINSPFLFACDALITLNGQIVCCVLPSAAQLSFVDVLFCVCVRTSFLLLLAFCNNHQVNMCVIYYFL